MALGLGLGWHEGEEAVQRMLDVHDRDNNTQPMLSQQAAVMLQNGPLLALGTLDAEQRPWTTVWGGEAPLSQPLGQNMVGIKSRIDPKLDPVVKILFGEKHDEDKDLMQGGQGLMVAGLTINLETRKRVKLYGRMVAGGLITKNNDEDNKEAQLVLRIDQSLGNCPKYLNKKDIKPADPAAELISDSPILSEEANGLISRSDLFFISSAHLHDDMDTNHRGGAAGFVRTSKDPSSGASVIIWPEYSGNRLYQTLGNLYSTPKAGLVFPDFVSGDVLYLTGTTEILVNGDAAKLLPRSNLAVRLTITAAKHVRAGLPFRGVPGEQSPYNPRVRLLASEAVLDVSAEKPSNQATLQTVEHITPTISRYGFRLAEPVAPWEPGAWVAFDFSKELDMGYSHMRDDDPRSLNDDFVRTFTVSSPLPSPDQSGDVQKVSNFEITIRRVGVATEFLKSQKPWSHVGGLELGVRGFGGGLPVHVDRNGGKPTGFVAGGVGITPLLAQLPQLDLAAVRLFWTVTVDDVPLVLDALRTDGLAERTSVFVTGAEDQEKKDAALQRLKDAGVKLVEARRLARADLLEEELGNAWYACVSPGLRKSLLQWLDGKEVLYEDFNF